MLMLIASSISIVFNKEIASNVNIRFTFTGVMFMSIMNILVGCGTFRDGVKNIKEIQNLVLHI